MTNPFRGRAATLVGRDDEIEVLASVLRDATAGRGGTLFVAGEPGIGKTRLTAEAVDMAARAGMAVLKGRCTTTGPAVPFRPLTEALLSLTRAGEAPPAEELGPYLPVLGRLVPEWSTGEDCDQSPVVLAEAVLRLAAARGRERGCLLLVDDLHDADPETLAVLEYIAANVAGQPVAVVATVRSAPSTAYELAGAVAQRREAVLLTLGRLDADHIHAFAASCLGCAQDALAPAVSAHVYADSDGIPFVAEELIRGMLAEERLRFDRGRWRDADEADEAGGVGDADAPGGAGGAGDMGAPGGAGGRGGSGPAVRYAAGPGAGSPIAPTTWGTAGWFTSDGFAPGATEAPTGGLAGGPPNAHAALPPGGDAAPYATSGRDTAGSRAGTPGEPIPGGADIASGAAPEHTRPGGDRRTGAPASPYAPGTSTASDADGVRADAPGSTYGLGAGVGFGGSATGGDAGGVAQPGEPGGTGGAGPAYGLGPGVGLGGDATSGNTGEVVQPGGRGGTDGPDPAYGLGAGFGFGFGGDATSVDADGVAPAYGLGVAGGGDAARGRGRGHGGAGAGRGGRGGGPGAGRAHAGGGDAVVSAAGALPGGRGQRSGVRGRGEAVGLRAAGPRGRGRVPFTLARAVEQRAARLGPEGVHVLSAAAVLGRSFPLTVLRRCAGPDEPALRACLRAAVAEGLLVHDDERGPDWYAFEHPLTEEALLSLLTPVERAELSVRAADAVDLLYPGLPGTWCHLAARLRRHAGELGAAAALYLEVARRALADSGPGTAIAVLDEAHRMLGDAPDRPVQSGVHRELLETLLFALADDGQFDRAAQVVDRLRRADTGADLTRRVELHVRLAWAAEVAGRWVEGMDQVAAARALLPADAPERDTAGIDAVEAYLTVSGAEQGRIEESERLARRAIEGAEQRVDPALACQAWYAVGFATRGRSLTESDRCFRRTLRIATESDLMIWRNHGLIGLGSNAWLAEAVTDSLAFAHREALRTGCVSLAHNAGVMLALDAALKSDFARATALLDGSLDETRRLQLHSVTRYALMLRAVVAAHQGRRGEMRGALAEFRAGGGDQSREAPLALGLGELFCALLEEDREQAAAIAARIDAGAPGSESFFHFAGTHGLSVLLSVLDGGGREQFERVAGGQPARMRWNRQFVHLADAVLLGREGRAADAQRAVRAAMSSAAVFPTARHLGLRLAADAAMADGWGEPRRWLTEAEEFFHRGGVVAVAGACRSRLRTLGVSVRQRRAGTDRIPEELRALGVTSREYDVFRLLVDRLGNKALAARLHLSTRTVEKHVASLVAKTGVADRTRLCDYTVDFLSARRHAAEDVLRDAPRDAQGDVPEV